MIDIPNMTILLNNNLKISYDIEKDIMYNCNVDRIKQLFSILVDNAIKHANEKSKISVMVKKKKDTIQYLINIYL